MQGVTKNFFKKYVFLGSFYLISSFADASDGHFYLGGDLGTSQANLGINNPEITYYYNYFTDAYPLNNTHATTGMLGLNGGYEFSGSEKKPAVAVGIGIYNTPEHYNYSGTVIETPVQSPATTLYTYQYQISSMRIMAESKLTWTIKNHVVPFVDFGVGRAWNTLSHYQETAEPGYFVAYPGFQAKTSINLAYQAGFGCGYAFNLIDHNSSIQHERLSLAYRFVNLGDTSFDARSAAYPYALHTGRLKTQDVYLNFSHVF